MANNRVEFKLVGVPKLANDVRQLADRYPDKAAMAVREEAEIEMTEAKRRTPVLTGALRGSGHVVGPMSHGRDISVSLEFGGAAAPYAVEVHENLEAYHKTGQAKFLESVLLESAPYLAQRIAARIGKGKP